eukprot:NODE_12482_length_509_cov_56.797927_g12192_i0.p1 GENE.NODE_12482_length_509_cov_56.797927_g12192_i0~~NODE_12482_length_509_cov_56.797927_g12192_i0.p1  ORF type:complete len:114 (-),score=9.06 NODE_12482_length_509_cov_56.797927_g12192_i0:161-502(-)
MHATYPSACRNQISMPMYSAVSTQSTWALISDFCMLTGKWRAFNRNSVLYHNTSVFQKMSFETSLGCLIRCAFNGDRDDLASPSARLIVGQGPKLGVGASFETISTQKRKRVV